MWSAILIRVEHWLEMKAQKNSELNHSVEPAGEMDSVNDRSWPANQTNSRNQANRGGRFKSQTLAVRNLHLWHQTHALLSRYFLHVFLLFLSLPDCLDRSIHLSLYL